MFKSKVHLVLNVIFLYENIKILKNMFIRYVHFEPKSMK